MNKIWQKLAQYLLLMRLHRPIGIYLLLWPTLWALWIAGEGRPNIAIVLVFIFGVVIMRSAGCIINDVFDRKIDKHVKRTAQRPIARGSVSVTEAVVVFAILCGVAFILALQLNAFAFHLSFIALFLTMIYPLMKRYMYLPQVILGMAFAWSIPMSFAAQAQHLTTITWLLYVIGVSWPLAYDSIYALMDKEDDLKIGVKSSAILFGRYDIAIITLIQFFVILCFIYVGLLLKFSIYFYTALLIASFFVIYQSLLIATRDVKKFYTAFYSNHYMGLIIFIGIVCNYF